MKIGYARVSTEEQNLSLQKQALQAAGCKVIIENPGGRLVFHMMGALAEFDAGLSQSGPRRV